MPITNKATCPPLGSNGPCGALPHSFSRLRYFFGKRLGVADFVDEQRFHLGKQRFHNQHLHGAGVVCGLAADVFDDTVLRIRKGAALDHCGREIIVGTDQCVDVDAWYQQQIEADPAVFDSEVDASGTLRLCVTIGYQECKTGPEPAPRDPCSCSEDGCDYGRTLESFALNLATETEARTNREDSLFPSEVDIESALQSGNIDAALGAAVMAGCPQPVENNTLLILCFTAQLSEDRTSVDSLAALEATPILLSSAALQRVILTSLAASGSPALGGPSISELTLAQDIAVPTNYVLSLALDRAIEASSFEASAFSLSAFDSATGWTSIPAGDLVVSYRELPTPMFELAIDNSAGFLADASRYRLVVESNASTPMVDSSLRSITPQRYVRQFAIADTAGDLTLAQLPA